MTIDERAASQECQKCKRAHAVFCAECFEGEKRVAVEEATAEKDRQTRISDGLIKANKEAWSKAKAATYEDAARVAREFATTLIFSSDGLMTMDEAMKVRKMQREQIADAIEARAAELSGNTGELSQ